MCLDCIRLSQVRNCPLYCHVFHTDGCDCLELCSFSEMAEPLGPVDSTELAVVSKPVEIEIETPDMIRKRQRKWVFVTEI